MLSSAERQDENSALPDRTKHPAQRERKVMNMDLSEVKQTAAAALDSVSLAHRRLDGLDAEIKDIRSLTSAMAAVNEKVDCLNSDVQEIKSDVKEITRRPVQLWDKLIAGILGAAAAGIAAALLQLILK